MNWRLSYHLHTPLWSAQYQSLDAFPPSQTSESSGTSLRRWESSYSTSYSSSSLPWLPSLPHVSTDPAKSVYFLTTFTHLPSHSMCPAKPSHSPVTKCQKSATSDNLCIHCLNEEQNKIKLQVSSTCINMYHLNELRYQIIYSLNISQLKP